MDSNNFILFKRCPRTGEQSNLIERQSCTAINSKLEDQIESDLFNQALINKIGTSIVSSSMLHSLKSDLSIDFHSSIGFYF